MTGNADTEVAGRVIAVNENGGKNGQDGQRKQSQYQISQWFAQAADEHQQRNRSTNQCADLDYAEMKAGIVLDERSRAERMGENCKQPEDEDGAAGLGGSGSALQPPSLGQGADQVKQYGNQSCEGGKLHEDLWNCYVGEASGLPGMLSSGICW